MSDKFNTIMPESEGCVICVMIDKPITADGYRDNYITRVEKIIEQYGELRVLVYFKEYQGWEKEAAAMDFAEAPKSHDRMTKCAMVNPPPTLITLKEVRKDIFKAETRIFRESELQDALQWIKQD